MGGLVIKKAYVLAHQDIGKQRQLAERMRCIFFLATPHRGADYASLLNGILAVSGFSSSREYISDLRRGSTSAQLINEDFGRLASSLHLYSFYETLPMVIGSSLVVEKESALLGMCTLSNVKASTECAQAQGSGKNHAFSTQTTEKSASSIARTTQTIYV